ncbi:MAG: hypothetical protein ACR2QM_20035 [Longimicrobiales bacterium]
MTEIFEFLFKYRPLLYQEGELTFLSPWPLLLVGAVALVLTVLAVLSYSRARAKSSTVDRWILGALRGAALVLLFFIIMQPGLVLTSVVPQRNFIAVLVDDSRSMTIEDADGTPRAEKALQIADPTGDLMTGLADRFAIRYFRFSSAADRVDGTGELTFDGSHTRLGSALTFAQDELQGVPLSGVVVVSDGGDNGEAVIGDALLPLQAASVPVYTIGVGDETTERDVQISRVDVPEQALVGTSLVVNVLVDATGYAGQTVPIIVEDFGRIVTTEDVTLPDHGQPLVAPLGITFETEGVRELTFRIPGQEGERVLQNNAREVVVQVRDAKEKILYFEGEPRFEVAFMRRAIGTDENIQLVVLQRTAENKFLRLNVDDELELVAGFPTTREELFQYKAIILGSIEASFFTQDQLDMMADFVSSRGGSLMMLGGRRSFAEGGYKGTALEDVLPVLLPEPEPSSTPTERLVFVRATPTPAGANHSATRINGSAAASAERWDSLPPVSTTNQVFELKPGATALLEGEVVDGAGSQQDRVVLASQRYGKGQSMVLAVQDTWLWQMDATVPLEDQSHETFWRQVLRWLVSSSPEPVEASANSESVEAGEPVTLTGTVMDGGFIEVNGANVTASVTTPTGEVRELPMEWSVETDGEYTASFTPDLEGIYEVSVDALRDTVPLGTGLTNVRVAPSGAEFRDPHQRRSLLERVADDTGGRYYTTETLDQLSEDLRFTGGGVTVTEERDLWDMPLLFLLLAGLMAGEWGFRRKRGLV